MMHVLIGYARSIGDLQDIVRTLKAQGMGLVEIARRLGIARASVYRALGTNGSGEAPDRGT